MYAAAISTPGRDSDSGKAWSLRCFPKPQSALASSFVSPWFGRWQAQFAGRNQQLNAVQVEALAQLVPLLLCGEQSAQHVFHQQATAAGSQALVELATALDRIEQEEAVHEQALQTLAASLPMPEDAHQRKRRAQRFYAGLAHDVSVAGQFSRIEALDSAVCRIMYSLARATWGKNHPLYHLFDAIKCDEARHVGVSRRYASSLGLSEAERRDQRRLIGARVVAFLAPDAAAFEHLGVDAQALFRRLTVNEVA